MKKNTSSKRMTTLLVALVLVTSLFVGGTIARYVTSTSSEDEARVAVWGINEVGPIEMDLFNATYVENGVTVAQSNNGTDKIIAPGTHNDNQFKIVNTNATLAPEVMYEIRINLDDSEIDPLILNNPSIQWRLDNGSYGTWEETKAKILMLSGDASGVKTYAPGTMEHEFANGKTHTIGWQWIIDNGTDELDTEMGNAVARGEEIKATIKVSVTARQVDTDTTGMLAGDGSVYNINNPQPLTFRSVAPMEELQKVIVNDQELEEDTHYTVDSGSTVITLLKSFLGTLSKGKHTITIISENTTTKASFSVAELPVVHSGTIPVGGTYYVGVTGPYSSQWDSNMLFVGDYTGYTAKYEVGEKYPNTTNIGDVYVYGDFEYRYKQQYSNLTDSWTDTSIDGWGVRMKDKTKTTPGEILSYINNIPVTNMNQAFFYTNVSTAPEIPETVIHLNHSFSTCLNLNSIPAIPSNVKYIDGLLYMTYLKDTNSIEINTNPQSYSEALHGSNVTEITGTTELKEEILNSCSCM